MNYRNIYIRIIHSALKQNRKKHKGTYYEVHHILPKSLFPLWKNRKANKVLLTAREHFFVHKLLVKIYPGREMACALWRMANGNFKISSYDYEKAKQLKASIESTRMKGNTNGFTKGHTSWCKDTKGIVKAWNKGLKSPYSDETLKQMSDSHKGKSNGARSEQTKAILSAKLTEYYRNNPMSEEQKEKIRQTKLACHFSHTKETKEKIRQARLGKKLTEQEKINYKKSARRRYQGKAILCVNTNEVFNCPAEIIDKYPFLNKGHIIQVCRGKRHYAGMINEQKAIWRYVD